MAMGEMVAGTVERLAAGGAGILTVRGKRIFMDFTAPGDAVAGRIIRETRDWAQAELAELREASHLRDYPPCPFYGRCGGCSLQHLRYEAQAEAKALMLRDAFARLGGMALPESVPMVPSPPWEYRNRIQLHRAAKAGATPGFMGRRSGELVPVDDCPVADPALRAALREAAVTAPPNQDRFTLYARAGTLLGEGAIRGKTTRRGTVTLRGREILLDAGVFFQSNGAMLEKLLDELVRAAQGADTRLPMADLYCGVGTFAAFLGGMFPRADLVEENPAAIALARENTRGMEARLFAQTGDLWAKGWAAESGGAKGMDGVYGFMVADPPRQGLSPALRRALAEKGPPILAYVSCDPATLARDSGELVTGGYRLERLTGFDFYPQTAHVESLAVFSR